MMPFSFDWLVVDSSFTYSKVKVFTDLDCHQLVIRDFTAANQSTNSVLSPPWAEALCILHSCPSSPRRRRRQLSDSLPAAEPCAAQAVLQPLVASKGLSVLAPHCDKRPKCNH